MIRWQESQWTSRLWTAVFRNGKGERERKKTRFTASQQNQNHTTSSSTCYGYIYLKRARRDTQTKDTTTNKTDPSFGVDELFYIYILLVPIYLPTNNNTRTKPTNIFVITASVLVLISSPRRRARFTRAASEVTNPIKSEYLRSSLVCVAVERALVPVPLCHPASVVL